MLYINNLQCPELFSNFKILKHTILYSILKKKEYDILIEKLTLKSIINEIMKYSKNHNFIIEKFHN